MGYREAIAKVIVETLAFTKPFIHFDRLAELGLVDVTNNGGTWRTMFEKNYRFTVVYTTKRKPLHTNTTFEDETKFENVESSFVHLKKPENTEVLGLFIWGRTIPPKLQEPYPIGYANACVMKGRGVSYATPTVELSVIM